MSFKYLSPKNFSAKSGNVAKQSIKTVTKNEAEPNPVTREIIDASINESINNNAATALRLCVMNRVLL